MAVNLLTDVEPEAISIVTKGANRKRFFLKKMKGRSNLLDLPSSHRVVKAADWQAVYCVVAEPGALEDAGLHGDQAVPDRWASEDEIRKAAHRFMKRGGLVNLMHRSLEPFGRLVENAIALDDFTVDGETIRKGSWYIAFEPNEQTKTAIEEGTFGGVSLQGTGTRTLVEKARPWDEKKHPREGGKFAPKGTSSVEGQGGMKGRAKPKPQVEEEQRKARTIRTAANLLASQGYSGNLGQAIRDFQRKSGLPETGELDEETMSQLRASQAKHRAEAASQRAKPKGDMRAAPGPEPKRRKRSKRPRAKGGIAKRSLGHGGENWITRLPKGMQTAWEHSWAHRAAVHLVDKGMSVGHAIAVGTNAAKKLCATGDVNWPGMQNVNPGSRAEACASVALWESMKAAAHAQGGSIAKSGEETEESVEAVFAELEKIDWNPLDHPRGLLGRFIETGGSGGGGGPLASAR